MAKEDFNPFVLCEPPEVPSEHIARVVIHGETLCRMLHLPEGTEIVRCRSSEAAGMIELVVRHKDLRPAKAGESTPFAYPRLRIDRTPYEASMGGEGRISFAGWGQ